MARRQTQDDLPREVHDIQLQPLTKYPHVVTSSSSADRAPVNMPRASFDSFDGCLDSGLEDAFISTTINQKRKPSWRRFIPMAIRRKISSNEDDNEAKAFLDNPLLATGHPTKKASRRRVCYNFCIFGGISGTQLLAILLSVNLILVALTLYWHPDVDRVLQNWGKAGSGTEGLSWYPTDFTRDIIPIPCNSHNDYWRKIPLFSALRAGCTGVEADVWLFDDDLYVGHNTASLNRNRTFQSLYVNPIVKILEDQNPDTEFFNGTNHGVFDADPEKSLILLVDLKTSGPETWPMVLRQLEPLRERGWLTFTENNKVHQRAVTVVGTGNTPFDVLTANVTYRDAYFDAPLETMWESRHAKSDGKSWRGLEGLTEGSDEDEGSDEALPGKSYANVGQGLTGTDADSEFNETNSYYASVAFGKAVGRIWYGSLSHKQIRVIRGQVRGAHRRGLKVRYWDLPSWPHGLRNHVWDVLIREGVDVLNVDDLRAASKQAW